MACEPCGGIGWWANPGDGSISRMALEYGGNYRFSREFAGDECVCLSLGNLPGNRAGATGDT